MMAFKDYTGLVKIVLPQEGKDKEKGGGELISIGEGGEGSRSGGGA